MSLHQGGTKKQFSSDQPSSAHRSKNPRKVRADAVSSVEPYVKPIFTKVVQGDERTLKPLSTKRNKQALERKWKVGFREANAHPRRCQTTPEEQGERLNGQLESVEVRLEDIALAKQHSGLVASIGLKRGLLSVAEARNIRFCLWNPEVQHIETDGVPSVRLFVRPCHKRQACPVCHDYWSTLQEASMRDDTVSVAKCFPSAVFYMVTFTPPRPSHDLLDLVHQVIDAMAELIQQRNNYGKREAVNPRSLMARVLGGKMIMEYVKKQAYGRITTKWWPHYHGIWAADSVLDPKAFQREIRQRFGPGWKIDLRRLASDQQFQDQHSPEASDPASLPDHLQRQRRAALRNDAERIADYATKDSGRNNGTQAGAGPEPDSVSSRGDSAGTPYQRLVRRTRKAEHRKAFEKALFGLLLFNALKPPKYVENPETGEIDYERPRAPNGSVTFGVYYGIQSRLRGPQAPKASRTSPDKNTGDEPKKPVKKVIASIPHKYDPVSRKMVVNKAELSRRDAVERGTALDRK